MINSKSILLIIAIFISTFTSANELLKKYLLFTPQEITINTEIAINQSQLSDLNEFLKESMQEASAGEWNLRAGTKMLTINFQIQAGLPHFDAYHLNIEKNTIHISAKNTTALRYAKQTLSYLLNYAKTEQQPLPQLQINDWANFEKRGYMLDISRNKVPTMESLYQLIDHRYHIRNMICSFRKIICCMNIKP